jgi:hypothetical protein
MGIDITQLTRRSVADHVERSAQRHTWRSITAPKGQLEAFVCC